MNNPSKVNKELKNFYIPAVTVDAQQSDPPSEYIFNEKEVLDEIKKYIDSTYSQHYAGRRKRKGKRIQTTEYLAGNCKNPEEAFRFTVMKYVARYGDKDGFNKKDLLKAVHYLVMMICYHNEFLEEKCE